MKDFYFDTKHNILKNKLNITDYHKLKAAEQYYCDLGFKYLNEHKYFSKDPEYIHYLHQLLFKELYDWAGKNRLIDVERPEPALGGLSIQYSHYKDIDNQINDVFLDVNRVNLKDLSLDEKLNYIIDVVVKIWHIHPFRDCNTRTLILFINQYCSSSSLSFNACLLRDNINYFRRSLVAAAFEDEELDVKANKEYTLKIMKDAFKNNY